MKKLLLLLLFAPSVYAMDDEAPQSPRALCRARIVELKKRLQKPYVYNDYNAHGDGKVEAFAQLYAKVSNDGVKKDLFETRMLLAKLEAEAKNNKQQQELKSIEK